MQLYSSSRMSLSKTISEDSFIINHRRKVYGVFDGATPLTPFMDERGRNGAYLASNLFKDYFENDFSHDMTLFDGVIQANKRLMEKMKLYNVDTAHPENLWSTCVAVVKVDENQNISFAQLGDCMVLAEHKSGEIEALTRDTVKDISVRAKIRREKERSMGMILPEESYYNDIRNQLIYNRKMANSPDGYTVANGTQEVRDYIHHGFINTGNLQSILLITDGLFYPNKDFTYIYRMIHELGLEEYAVQLEKYEKNRNLRSDDKTGILICF
ncbi:protein phosphatase 2C domain-containing protein [Bacillus songklensis]|uniref:Protein phosphatase 2C domain-containing protein n=1 Tax=Bacillus songklensis TaxID=1069116 RepID=A0ABV8B3W3_9BACI